MAQLTSRISFLLRHRSFEIEAPKRMRVRLSQRRFCILFLHPNGRLAVVLVPYGWPITGCFFHFLVEGVGHNPYK